VLIPPVGGAKTERCHYFTLCSSREMSLTANGIAAPERSSQTPAIAEDVTGNRHPGQLSQSGRFRGNVTTMIQALRLGVFNQDRLGSTKMSRTRLRITARLAFN